MATPIETSPASSQIQTSSKDREFIDKALARFNGIWTMTYRHNSGLASLNFVHNGTLKGARERSLRYCQVMGYRQIFVTPFIIDMDTVEEQQLSERGGPRNLGHPDTESVKLMAGANGA